MNNFMRIFSVSCVALLALTATSASADTDADTSAEASAVESNWLGDNWSFNGFGTIGYTQTDKYDDRIPRRTIFQSGSRLQDNGFLLDSRLGFQVKGQITDHWDVVAQVVAREQFANDFEDYIDIAFARYSTQDQWTFSVGRQAFDLFFVSDHQSTGYSYDWVRPPTEFYGSIPYNSFDGFKIAKQWGDFDNDWQWKLSVGNIKAEFDNDVVVNSADVDTTKANPIYGTELTWQTGQWHVRASYALFKFEQALAYDDKLDMLVNDVSPFWPEFGRIVGDFTVKYDLSMTSLGALWQYKNWKIQSEWSRISTDFIGYNGDRAYIHVAKRFNAWRPFVTLGYAHDNQQVRYAPPPYIAPTENAEFNELVEAVNEFYVEITDVVKSMRHNQHSISLGVRWDVAPHKALKLQCDKFYFKAGSGSIHGRTDFKYRNNESRSWCSVALDWVF
ncbi:MAG: hypothetical protein MJK04_26750 [Psychrosphaera sp.]|nr:hypothetical protein [Psychrosphaera sp.]